MISWMGPGGNINATNDRVFIESDSDDDSNMYTRSLKFTYLMEEDNGTYTCNVMILETSGTQSFEMSLTSELSLMVLSFEYCGMYWIISITNINDSGGLGRCGGVLKMIKLYINKLIYFNI